MATCPTGHESASTDFCDTCGMRMDRPPASMTGAAASGATASGGPAPSGPGATAPPPGPPCPNCGTTRSGQFCEACGYDYATGRVPGRPGAAAPAPPDPAAPDIYEPTISSRFAPGSRRRPAGGWSTKGDPSGPRRLRPQRVQPGCLQPGRGQPGRSQP